MEKICVIGVGFVGEHIVNAFKNFYNVIGIDTSLQRIQYLKTKYDNVHFQCSYENLDDCKVFIISVPTLVNDNKDVDMTFIKSVRERLNNTLQKESLIVIESSVYVGATRELFNEFVAKNIHVAFSPERVDPGRLEPKYEDIPKIISGLNSKSLEACARVYQKVFKNLIQVSSTECAEMCKLYENCFRMINIAYVNEIADMCESLNINVHEMIEASSTKPFGFMPFYPGLGVGGHCIPVNPFYLFKNGSLPLLYFATMCMEKRPKSKANHIVNKFHECNNILLIGLAFKKGEKVLTNSPSASLCEYLLQKGKTIYVYDPYVESSNYLSKSVQFIDKEMFSKQMLDKQIDLVIQTHSLSCDENVYINNFRDSGGQVYSFVA